MRKKRKYYLCILCIFFSLFLYREPNLDFFSISGKTGSIPLRKTEIRKKSMDLQLLVLKEKTSTRATNLVEEQIKEFFAIYGGRFILAPFLILLLSLFFFSSLSRVRKRKRRQMRVWMEIKFIHLRDGKKRIII